MSWQFEAGLVASQLGKASGSAFCASWWKLSFNTTSTSMITETLLVNKKVSLY